MFRNYQLRKVNNFRSLKCPHNPKINNWSVFRISGRLNLKYA